MDMTYHYVYSLQSQTDSDRFYTGYTDNLDERLRVHNQGKCKHTSKYSPWRIKTTIAFTNKERALDFEKYLKTAYGRAFSKNDYRPTPCERYHM